jgi:hypothetical protein
VVGLITVPLRFQMSTFCVQPKNCKTLFFEKEEKAVPTFFGGEKCVWRVGCPSSSSSSSQNSSSLPVYFLSANSFCFFRLFWWRTTIFLLLFFFKLSGGHERDSLSTASVCLFENN